MVYAMNKYDDVHLDVVRLLKEQARPSAYDPGVKSADDLGFRRLGAVSRLYLTGLLYKTGIYQRLIYSNLKLDWFYEFRDYWVNELGHRPIDPHDFHFLRGVYRQKFQDVEVPGLATDAQHLNAWRDPRNIYLLFANQYKLALQPLSAHRFIKYVPRNGRVCEYGCGLAPIATGLCKFYPQRNVCITCADLPTILFHFARWKFREKKFIRMVEINHGNDEPLDGEFDVIFCMAVLEHLPRPGPVIKHLHSRIRRGGYLIFDYLKTEGKGLDTQGAARDRISVLRYILDKFEVVEGKPALDGSDFGTIVCKKV
jgi:2-polyprenyl-3-methyl-5-hydroxy-6-metoxy-1,4-benzoquinol methylase